MRTLASVGLVLLVPQLALAGSRDFLIEHAGSGGTQQQAAPFVAKFLRYAEAALGWPANSVNGDFFSEPADALSAIAAKKPGFGMLDPDQLLELRKKESVEVLASATGKNQLGKLHLVVKNPAYKTLADLKGKTVVSNHLQSARFLSKVVFDGKIDVKTHFAKLTEAPGMLKGVKSVDRGEADATLLSEEELVALKGMAYPDLHVIWSSETLPPTAVVAFGKNVQAKDKDAFGKMLLKMCADPKGAPVCKELDIVKFTPPADYDVAQKKFDRP